MDKLIIGATIAGIGALLFLNRVGEASDESKDATGSTPEPKPTPDGKPLILEANPSGKSGCDVLSVNLIATGWHINPKTLWAIFGVESDFGRNIGNAPNDGRGPMQITNTTAETLRRAYPKLAGYSVYDCRGAMEYACAHLHFTANLLGLMDWSDPRNIVAYNSGAGSSRARQSREAAMKDWYYIRYERFYKAIGGK